MKRFAYIFFAIVIFLMVTGCSGSAERRIDVMPEGYNTLNALPGPHEGKNLENQNVEPHRGTDSAPSKNEQKAPDEHQKKEEKQIDKEENDLFSWIKRKLVRYFVVTV